jgi:hypothetical protein
MPRKLPEIISNPKFCSECCSIQEEILSYEFVFLLVMWCDILVKIKSMKKCNVRLDKALKHSEEFLCWLNDYRRNTLHLAVGTAIKIAVKMCIQSEFKHKLHKKKRHFDYECPDKTRTNFADVFRTEHFDVIFDKISVCSEHQSVGLKTYSTNFGFLFVFKEQILRKPFTEL